MINLKTNYQINDLSKNLDKLIMLVDLKIEKRKENY